jgi:hypothetical protein
MRSRKRSDARSDIGGREKVGYDKVEYLCRSSATMLIGTVAFLVLSERTALIRSILQSGVSLRRPLKYQFKSLSSTTTRASETDLVIEMTPRL